MGTLFLTTLYCNQTRKAGGNIALAVELTTLVVTRGFISPLICVPSKRKSKVLLYT